MTILNGNMSSQISRKRKISLNYFVTERFFMSLNLCFPQTKVIN